MKKFLLSLFPFLLLELCLRVMGIGGGVVYLEDPDVGYRAAPNQRFSTMGFPITILDSGFRAPAPTRHLLFVGDSVTYGTAYIKDEDTFAALLGGANAGVNGWGLQNVAAALRTWELDSVDTVVWTIPSCDSLRSFMTLRGGLISTNRRMFLRLEYIFRFIWYGYLFPSQNTPDPAQYAKNEQALLDTAARLEEKGKSLLVVFLPYREEVQGTDMPETPYFNQLKDKAREANLWMVEANPTGAVETIFRDSAHLTPAGNQWLAGVIGQALADKK